MVFFKAVLFTVMKLLHQNFDLKEHYDYFHQQIPEYSAALYNTLSYNMDLIITWSCVFFYHGILQRNYRKIVSL